MAEKGRASTEGVSGEMARRERKLRGWNQRDLADRAGIERGYLSRNERLVKMSKEIVAKLDKAFGSSHWRDSVHVAMNAQTAQAMAEEHDLEGWTLRDVVKMCLDLDQRVTQVELRSGIVKLANDRLGLPMLRRVTQRKIRTLHN